jgi:aminopeptidase N
LKKLIQLFILFLWNIQLFAQINLNADPEHFCSRKMIHKHSLSLSKDIIQTPLLHDYDVIFYFLDLEVENNTTYISGQVTIYAQTVVNELDTFAFELFDELLIDQVFINDIEQTVIRSNNEAFIPLAEPITLNSFFSVKIIYQGLPPSSSSFSGIFTAYDSIWNKHVTWTLSEPFSARQWWPTKQVLTDKADSVWVNITTSSDNMAGSIGLLSSVVSLPDNKVRYEWRSNYPIAYYLISFVVADYQEYNIYAKPAYLQGDSLLIQNYIYDSPGCLEYYKAGIDITVEFMELFSDLFSNYPFDEEKYGHCLAGFHGGMEHQTMTTIGGFSFSLVAHELGHMWFGDNVTCANWSDIWINEGFATYSDYLATDIIAGDKYSLIWKTNAQNTIMSEPGGSIYVPPEEVTYNNVDRIFDSRLSYWKGAIIIHMIRFELQNDELFFQVLQNFQEQFADSSASATDFLNILNETTGMDFTTFFEQWYYGEGYPIYAFSYKQPNGIFELFSSQTASFPEVTPFYKMHFPVKLYFKDGTDSTLIFLQTDHENIFTAPISKLIDSLQIDPDLWVLKKVESLIGIEENELNYSIHIYPNPFQNALFIENSSSLPVELVINDLKGNIIYKSELRQRITSINLSNFESGIYLINIKTGNNWFAKKIIKL